MLEWVVISSSGGSSQPRDQTHVSCSSCTAGGFFTAEPSKRVFAIFSSGRERVLVSITLLIRALIPSLGLHP